jgi:hypothetical protein
MTSLFVTGFRINFKKEKFLKRRFKEAEVQRDKGKTFIALNLNQKGMKTALFSSLFDLLGVLEKGSKRENL